MSPSLILKSKRINSFFSYFVNLISHPEVHPCKIRVNRKRILKVEFPQSRLLVFDVIKIPYIYMYIFKSIALFTGEYWHTGTAEQVSQEEVLARPLQGGADAAGEDQEARGRRKSRDRSAPT